MSGHSKWATIKRAKGANDAKRGAAFTKLANAITIAVREGGGPDPDSNFKLRLTIEKARQINMPNENIKRAIDRGMGKGDKGELQEGVYEGFGPGGIAVIVEAITDNKQRTQPEIKGIFDKSGGNMGQPGSIAYQFKNVGQITVAKNGKTLDDVFLIAAEAGATDVEEAEDAFEIYTEPSNLKVVQEALQSTGLTIMEAELSRIPTMTTAITDTDLANKIITFMEKLESHDDVQKVYANFDLQVDL